MKKLYRIYTEQTASTEDLFKGIGQYFEVFTVVYARGQWKALQGPSLIIEIITDKTATVRDLAQWIKGYLQQESVLVTEQEVKEELI